jgi:integrase
MAKVKLTKTTVDAATFGAKEYELRDTVVPGFLLKVTPAGRKIFMVQYRTNAGHRRKPVIGRFGELTVEQARSIAQDWLADVRKGKDPSAEKTTARAAPSVKELCAKFIEDYSKPKNRARTVKSYQGYIDRHIIPTLGALRAHEVKRSEVAGVIARMKNTPVTANRVLACLSKMFNMAEVWGFRDDGTNPCRHVPKYPESGKTRLITDDEMVRLFAYLERADVEGLEHPFLILGMRLQFAFAARMSNMEWQWVDFAHRRVVWPDSKTGEISKPMTEDAYAVLSTAPRLEGSPYVVPSISTPQRPMSQFTYFEGWKRVLERADIRHVGTHGIRHRATTEIANSGVPVKVGMQLTGHKTVTQFMRYVHTEDDQVRAAAETVASRRRIVLSGRRATAQPAGNVTTAQPTDGLKAPVAKPAGFDAGRDSSNSNTKLRNYRPFRRSGANRAAPPGTNHTGKARLVAAE